MTIRSLLIPTDGSEPAEAAADRGFALAAQLDAAVHVVSVADTSRVSSAGTGDATRLRGRLRERTTARAEALAQQAQIEGLEVTTATREGVPAAEITDYAAEADVDAVVMGTAGRGGVSRMVAGSVTDKVIRTAPVPVLTVGPDAAAVDDGDGGEIEDVLIPTDGSAPAATAAERSLDLAEQVGASVHLLAVADTDLTGALPTVSGVELLESAGTHLEELAETARERGLEATTTVREGRPAEEIVDYAADGTVDLVAMATAGRGGIDRLVLGSVTDTVVRNATVPVLTIRPDDVGGEGTAD